MPARVDCLTDNQIHINDHILKTARRFVGLQPLKSSSLEGLYSLIYFQEINIEVLE